MCTIIITGRNEIEPNIRRTKLSHGWITESLRISKESTKTFFPRPLALPFYVDLSMAKLLSVYIHDLTIWLWSMRKFSKRHRAASWLLLLISVPFKILSYFELGIFTVILVRTVPQLDNLRFSTHLFYAICLGDHNMCGVRIFLSKTNWTSSQY